MSPTLDRGRAAAAAIVADSIQNPPTHIVTHPTIYNVGLGSAPSWIAFNTISRMGVKINTGHTEGLGSNPIEVSFRFKTYGAATAASGVIRVGVRKIADDSFMLIAEHPVEFNPALIGVQQSAIIRGQNPYSLVAGDHVSIEFPANATSSIELPVSTSEAFPTNTVSQQYVSSWANTASNRPLAVTIRSLKSVAI
jgi:hypothetical protein